MLIVLPSYMVAFTLVVKDNLWPCEWQVNTDEGLEAFVRVLRLNGIHDYSVRQINRA